MEFGILGPLEARTAAGPVRLGGARQRALLAILLLNAGRVVSTERLIELIWGEEHPPTAATALQNHVSALRRLLEPGRGRGDDRDRVLVTRPPGYLIRVEPEQIDLGRFERLRAEGRRALAAGDPAAARDRLAGALSLWRGAPLADLAYEAFAQGDIARLEELRLSALEDRIEADFALGRHADVVGELEVLCADNPLRERLRQQLMLALYRSGRQAEALEVYRDTRRALVEELGIEPTRELQELERRVLVQDPTLDPPPPPAVVPGAAVEHGTAGAVRDGPSDTAGAPGGFVGRDRELGEVLAGLEAASSGRPALFLFAGEAGIGKSRLADEFATRAVARGARVLWGRCWEAGGAPAYWPWVQALRAYIRGTEAAVLRGQLAAGAGDVAQMLPDLRGVLGDLPDPPSSDPEGARFRLFDSTTSFLRAVGAGRPLVVVLDDMHAADASSLLLLRFVARELRDARVVIVASYRDSEAASNEALGDALAELRREPITRRFEIGGLAPAEAGLFIESIAGMPASPDLAASIHRKTEGNPLFMGELVRLLVSEGRLEDMEAGWPRSLPRGLQEVIGHRLRRLSDECKRVLSVASVLGREFDLDALEHVAGPEPRDLLDLLDEAGSAGVVGDVPGRRGALRFSHALIRDSLYGGLGASERLELHRRTAHALETLYRDDPDPHLAELAHHFLEAAPLGRVDEAIHYAARAGARAAALLAYEEATRLYGMALEALELRPSRDEATRCDLLLGLGDAQARAGGLSAARETFMRAAELAGTLEDPERLARAALGYGGRFVWFRAGKDRRLIPLLERALAAQPDGDSVLRARLLSRLAGAIRDQPPPGRRAALSREGVEMARRLDDPATLAYTLHGTYAALWWPADTDAWLATTREIAQLAERAGEREHLFDAHMGAFAVHMLRGDVASARHEVAASRELAEELREPWRRWAATPPLAMLALFSGALDDAEEFMRRNEELGATTQGPDTTFYFTTNLQEWALLRCRGRLAEVEGRIAAFVEEYPMLAIFRCILASVHAELGDEDEARRHVDLIAADDFAALHLGTEWCFSASLIAEVCATLGDVDRAGSLYEALEPFAAYNVVAHPEVALGSVSRYLGLLASALGRRDAAAAHFERALEMNSRMGARPWTARTQDDYARMLLARAGPGDAERAGRLAEQAVATYREIGMEAWAERCAERTARSALAEPAST